MAEGKKMLRIVRIYQDQEGNITGGITLYPPSEEGKVLNAREAKNAFDIESADGFDVWQNGGIFHVTPLFGLAPAKKVEVHKSDKSNAGALLQALHPLLEFAPEMGERTAVIYERPVQI